MMLVVFDSEADVKRLARMDMLKLVSHIECNTVHDLARSVIHKLQLYMLKGSSHKFARAKIHHIFGAKHRFLVSGAERIELSQSVYKLRRNL